MSNPETPTVEQFDLASMRGGIDNTMERQEDGEWVRHADYLTLQAECERLREENERFKAMYRNAIGQAYVAQTALEAQAADLARLRADKEQP